MTPPPRRARRARTNVRFWTFKQAVRALPYLASIMRSLREHALQMQSLRRRIHMLDSSHGRPGRETLIALEEARKHVSVVEDEFQMALEELTDPGVHGEDVLKGLALIPFLHGDQIGWFIFDLFAPEAIRFWRFQTDSEDTRRQITTAEKA